MDFSTFTAKYQKTEVIHFENNVSEAPVVSICVNTYQHAKYIKACLNGILEQDIDVPYEIIIGDDESKDGTTEICIEYAKKFPDKVRLILHKRENNIAIKDKPTGRFNFIYNLFSARGKYIAMCEGDDFWSDPSKLKKQIAFLENNNEYVATFHDNYIVDEFDKLVDETNMLETHKRDFDSHTMALGACMPMLSIVFRKKAVHTIPESILKVSNGDAFLFYHLSKYGMAHYHDEKIGSAYRVHSGGIWSVLSDKVKLENSVFTDLYIYKDSESSELNKKIEMKISKSFYGLFGMYAREMNVSKTIRLFFLHTIFKKDSINKESKLKYLKSVGNFFSLN